MTTDRDPSAELQARFDAVLRGEAPDSTSTATPYERVPLIEPTLDMWRVIDGIAGMVDRMAAVYPPGTLYTITGSSDLLDVFRHPPQMIFGIPVRIDPWLPPGTLLVEVDDDA